MSNCLGVKCNNHCCTSRFKGLSESLINKDKSKFVQILLSKEEVNRITECGYKRLIQKVDDQYYLKLNNDFSCSAYKNGKCIIYDSRPDVCKIYPYYFDPFCGICKDKNCPGNFEIDTQSDEIYKLLENRINLFKNPSHHFFDGYEIDNNLLKNEKLINKLIKEINETVFNKKGKAQIISYFNGKVKEDGGISCVILGANCHFSCHTFCYKNTVFIDYFGKANFEKCILPIILKYFPTTKFDLCNGNTQKGKFGKHIIIENMPGLTFKQAENLIGNIVKEIKMTKISSPFFIYLDNNNYDIIQPIAESHISIHKDKSNINIDVFSCKNYDEKIILKLLDIKKENIKKIQRGIYYK
ncbi:MAG: S-adenosylmethionine decarboxylase [Clostridia bacterium]|nr:S-adenosylmethionine decarboxylase [Clostridia bacterium]